MKIGRSSSTTLLVLGAALLGLAGMIPSPAGRLLLLALAGLTTVAVLVFRPSVIRRVIALLILAVVILQVLPAWDEYRVHMDRYRQHPTGQPGR